MQVITCKFSNTQRIPVLISDQRLPFLLPLTFTVTNLASKAYNTKRRYISVIKQLYSFYSGAGLNFEELALDGNSEVINRFLEEFILSSLIYTKPESLEALEKFLVWTADSFSKKADVSASIARKIQAFHRKRPGTERTNYKSLSDAEIYEIRKIASLRNFANPFKKSNRFRNWLIIEILLQSGLRIGEMLKLKVNDFIQHEDRYYMRVGNYKGDIEDIRKIEPSNKNIRSYRTVAVTSEFFELINRYILKERKPLRNGKKLKLSHSYLFVSERGNPISTSAVQVIFQTIQLQIRSTGHRINLSPHILRHTFTDNFLRFLTDDQGLDMERAKDELKSICGWSLSSVMPLRYAGKQINSMANTHNVDRLKKIGNGKFQ